MRDRATRASRTPVKSSHADGPMERRRSDLAKAYPPAGTPAGSERHITRTQADMFPETPGRSGPRPWSVPFSSQAVRLSKTDSAHTRPPLSILDGVPSPLLRDDRERSSGAEVRVGVGLVVIRRDAAEGIFGASLYHLIDPHSDSTRPVHHRGSLSICDSHARTDLPVPSLHASCRPHRAVTPWRFTSPSAPRRTFAPEPDRMHGTHAPAQRTL